MRSYKRSSAPLIVSARRASGRFFSRNSLDSVRILSMATLLSWGLFE
nr:MAG TPA: hypothetical protein [Caudoviricetes sp.]